MSKKFNHSEYEDDEDDDFDFEEITKAAAKKKRKRANEPQSKESKSSLSRSSTVGQEKVSTTIEIDQELSAKERARIILQAGVINKNSPSSPMRIPFRDDEVTVAAKSLMESLMNKRNRLTSKAAAVSNSGTTPHDVIDQFTLPVLRTSEQHRKLLEGQGVGIPSSMIDNGFVDEKVDKVRLKTRLNGKHEKIWTMNTRDPLSKLCAEFAKIYGLSEELVSFEFDGDSLDKNSSPQSLEMDNEDLIDAKVDGKLFAEAVELANAKKKSIVDVSSAGTKSLLQKEPSQLIKFKTRLNGKHEWKWKLPSQHTFKMFRQHYSEVYGLKSTDYKFEFDGDTIEDSATPKSLDMEDHDMIDVHVAKELYDAAVIEADKHGSKT